jgi:hypothetical protein
MYLFFSAALASDNLQDVSLLRDEGSQELGSGHDVTISSYPVLAVLYHVPRHAKIQRFAGILLAGCF